MSLLLALCVPTPVPSEDTQPTGGIGHGGKKKSKRVYIERDGKVLVFANASRAAAFVQNEKQQEQQEQKPTLTIVPQATIAEKPKATHQPIEIVEYDAIAGLVAAFRLSEDISALIQAHELDALMALYFEAERLRDEEDIELLLLAA